MKRGSTMFLRVVVVLLGAGAIGLCVLLFPWLKNVGSIKPEFAGIRYVLIGAYLAAIPFFIALYQAMELLSLIDKNTAFSELSIKALKTIKYCALAIAGIYLAAFPFLASVADADDSPGLGGLGLVIIGASFVVAVFAALLQKLFQSALDIKSENDLTV